MENFLGDATQVAHPPTHQQSFRKGTHHISLPTLEAVTWDSVLSKILWFLRKYVHDFCCLHIQEAAVCSICIWAVCFPVLGVAVFIEARLVAYFFGGYWEAAPEDESHKSHKGANKKYEIFNGLWKANIKMLVFYISGYNTSTYWLLTKKDWVDQEHEVVKWSHLLRSGRIFCRIRTKKCSSKEPIKS